MNWDRMSIDEFALFRRNGGDRVVNVKGTWWLEARPFFFRPLFPFSKVAPALVNYPAGSALGGVLHPVPANAPGNCRMNLFAYDHLQEYSLERTGKLKWAIKKSLGHFRAARLTDPGLFTKEAYPVYRSFYERTRYFYKKERTEREEFAAWAASVFANPKVVVIGAYRQDRLCAVEVSYQVEDVIVEDVLFAATDILNLQVTDFMLHTLREAAGSSDASLIFRGFPSGKASLDEAKMTRGCKLVKLPAYRRINPLALLIGKCMMNESYRKLAATTSPPADSGDSSSP